MSRWRGRRPRSLQSKMFFWFGATILMTGLTVGAVMWLLGSSGPTWHQEFARVQRFTLGRFARVWDAPPERDEFARSIARDLDVDVQLTDADGRVLGTFGEPLTCPGAGVKVTRGHEVLGGLKVCATRHHGFGPLRLMTALGVAGAMLWGASGVLARKLSRPIAELVRVAQDIGAGRLSSRVRPGRHPVGEVRVLGEVLNDMASRIEQQMKDQRALLATVSHEIRTPLARMRLLIEMARGGGGALDRCAVHVRDSCRDGAPGRRGRSPDRVAGGRDRAGAGAGRLARRGGQRRGKRERPGPA